MRTIILITMIVITTSTTTLAQYFCHERAGGQGMCQGECPITAPACLHSFVGDFCYCKDLYEPGTGNGGDVCYGLELQIGIISMQGVLSSAAGGTNIYSPGNQLTLTQQAAVTLRTTHSVNWGAGQQDITLPASTLSLTIQFDGLDPGNASHRLFHVVSTGAVLPSFASVALGGGQTGTNTFSLDPLRSSTGWVDLSSGEFGVAVYLRFFNGVFNTEPALVQAQLHGVFNPTTKVASLTTGESSNRVIAQSPGTTNAVYW